MICERTVRAAVAGLGLTMVIGLPAMAQETVRVGMCISWPPYAFLPLAEEADLVDGYRIDVTQFADQFAGQSALAAGQIDVLECTADYVPIGIAAGADTRLVAFGAPAYGVDHIVLAGGVEEADLAGKRIATAEGTIGHLLVGVWLESIGVPVDSIEIVNLQPDEAVGPMLSGALDGAWLYEPWIGQVLGDLEGARTVAKNDEPRFLEEGIFTDVVFMNADFIAERRDAALAVLKARFDAVGWWNENTDAGNAFFADRLGWSVADVESIMGTNGKFREAGVYVYDFDEAARVCGVLDGDPPFGLAAGAIPDIVRRINGLWIDFGLMDEMQPAEDGIDCSLMGDLVESGYRQALEPNDG